MSTPRARLIQLLFGFLPAQVLHALCVLEIPEHISAGRYRVAELADLTETHPRALHRLLRAAAALRLVEHRDDGTVALTGEGTLLLAGEPGSIHNLVRLWGGEEGWRSWGKLHQSVRTGGTAFEPIFGAPLFEYLSDHQSQRAVFNQAMAESSHAASPAVVEVLDLTGRRLVVDVGGGSGSLLAATLSAYPRLRGKLFDRPSSLPEANKILADAGLLDRCQLVGGDFFESVPAGADAYLLKSVLHDWDDERCAEILSNCRTAMPANAVLYVVEPVVPVGDDELASEIGVILSDLNMLVQTGGMERTEPELRDLLDAAGFVLEEVTRCRPPNNLSVLRAVPA